LRIALNIHGFSLLVQRKNRFRYLRMKGRLGFEDKTGVELMGDR
jgi:hypothetical protein